MPRPTAQPNAITLDRLPEFEESYLTWNIPMPPHLDQERLVVNLSSIQTVGRWAGFGHINYNQQYGEVTAVEAPPINGIFGDGTAAASASVATTREKAQSSSRHSDTCAGLPPEYHWPTAAVTIDRTVVTDRVINRKNNGAPDEQAWARELSRSLHRGILTEGRRHLCSMDGLAGNVVSVGLIDFGGWLFSEVTSGAATSILDSGNIAAAAIAAVALNNLYGIRNAGRHGGVHPIKDRRWSLVSAGYRGAQFQPDRMALAAFMSIGRLIKSRK